MRTVSRSGCTGSELFGGCDGLGVGDAEVGVSNGSAEGAASLAVHE